MLPVQRKSAATIVVSGWNPGVFEEAYFWLGASDPHMMKQSGFGFLAAGLLLAQGLDNPAGAQVQVPTSQMQKINAYVACINRLSARAHSSRERYFSWASATGPTGKERIIYGTYTIYDTSDCRKGVEAANPLEPRMPELEAAATAYVAAVSVLEPLLTEADDYYKQENYKDDNMAKGRALHPRLVAAWNAFAGADDRLRAGLDVVQDRRAMEALAEIEQTEGRKGRYHAEALMLRAKLVLRAQNTSAPDLSGITKALADYEAIVGDAEKYAAAAEDGKAVSDLVRPAKELLITSKQLMRRVRDKVPYSQGDRMMLNSGGGWMVEGSQPRLVRDYNQLIDAYNHLSRR